MGCILGLSLAELARFIEAEPDFGARGDWWLSSGVRNAITGWVGLLLADLHHSDA